MSFFYFFFFKKIITKLVFLYFFIKYNCKNFKSRAKPLDKLIIKQIFNIKISLLKNYYFY